MKKCILFLIFFVAIVDNFSVLKDATATAPYGSRATNVVILINTKSGKKNAAPLITFSAIEVTLPGRRRTILF